MSRRRYATSLSWGGDIPTAEIEVEVEYDVHWGRSARTSGPPEYYHEADPAEIDNIAVLTIDGKPGPFHDGFQDWADLVRDKLEMDCWDDLLDNATGDVT